MELVDMRDFLVGNIKGECISWKLLCRSWLIRRKPTQRRAKLSRNRYKCVETIYQHPKLI